jgi:hypothetical protein
MPERITIRLDDAVYGRLMEASRQGATGPRTYWSFVDVRQIGGAAMAQLIKIVRDWCQTCHRGYATCTLIGADRRMIGRCCHQCGERALRKAKREEQRQSMAQ